MTSIIAVVYVTAFFTAAILASICLLAAAGNHIAGAGDCGQSSRRLRRTIRLR